MDGCMASGSMVKQNIAVAAASRKEYHLSFQGGKEPEGSYTARELKKMCVLWT